MTYDSFIWDFDGTICDSYPFFHRCFIDALRSFSPCPQYDEDLILKKLHITIPTAYSLFPDLMPELRKRTDERYFSLMEKTLFPPCKGAIELLRGVVREGGKNYLYTHSGDYVYGILEQYGVSELFSGGVTAQSPDLRFPGKPAPDALLWILKEYRLTPSRTVMIGDRDIDVLAGQNAGIDGCLFDEDGYYPDTPATYRVKRLSDFAAAVGISFV